MRFMHDVHVRRAFLFLDILAEYTLLLMTVVVTRCLWYVVGMKLVISYVKFGTSLAFYGALPRKLPKKTEKGFPGPLGPEAEKTRKKSRK